MSLFKSTLLRQRLRKGKENIIILGIIAFLVMSFWSLVAMPMDMNGHMINCPFMNGSSSFCQMNISEHINQWKQLFIVTREKNLFLLSLPLLVLLFSVVSLIIERIYNKLKLQPVHNYLYKYKPEIKLFDNILIAFSQGIIRSQIYA